MKWHRSNRAISDFGIYAGFDFRLAVEEVIAEKIRAASQRSKIRDLYDLAEISQRPLNQEVVRSLAVLKLWQGGGAGLDFDRFRQRVEAGDEYDVKDLQNLLRKDQKPDLAKMIGRVCCEFRFLGQLTKMKKIWPEIQPCDSERKRLFCAGDCQRVLRRCLWRDAQEAVLWNSLGGCQSMVS